MHKVFLNWKWSLEERDRIDQASTEVNIQNKSTSDLYKNKRNVKIFGRSAVEACTNLFIFLIVKEVASFQKVVFQKLFLAISTDLSLQ